MESCIQTKAYNKKQNENGNRQKNSHARRKKEKGLGRVRTRTRGVREGVEEWMIGWRGCDGSCIRTNPSQG